MELIKGLINGVGSAAVILSLTRTIADEEKVKQYLNEDGYICAVTEVGGNTSQGAFQERVIKAIVGAVLNNNIVTKEPAGIHAVLHAAMEAKKGIISNTATSSNVSAKIAIVRKDPWVAVSIFGESALYHITNHERGGLGIMHI